MEAVLPRAEPGHSQLTRTGVNILKIPTRRLLLLLTLLIGGAAAAGEPAQQVLEKVASAYGATPPAAIRQTGTTTSFTRGNGTLKRLFRAPDRFRSEISYASGIEVRTLHGAMAWNQGAQANAAARSAIVLQAARIALPWNLLALKSGIVDKGVESNSAGKAVQIIEFQVEPQLKMIVGIEIESGHIVRSLGIMAFGAQTVEFATHYSDFHSQGGRTYAGREEQFATGRHIGYSIIDRVEYPQTLPDSAFEPGTVVDARQPADFELLATATALAQRKHIP